MKKTITLTVVALVLISLFSVAFAATTDNMPQWFNDMISWQKARLEQAVENGTLTEEQAQEFIDRLEARSKQSLIFASEEVPQWFYDKIDWQKDKLEQAVEDGIITEEQAQEYITRLEDRVKFVEENGFECFNQGFGMGRKGFGPRGFGGGRRAGGFDGFNKNTPTE